MNDQDVIDEFQRLWYTSLPGGKLHRHDVPMKWCGVPIVKWPCDLFTLQEVIWETAPDLIIETGTHKGGSAIFMRELLNTRDPIHLRGKVMSIDSVDQRDDGFDWSGDIEFHIEDSLWAIERAQEVAEDQRTMIVLDSDHTARHVYTEMDLYGPLVTPGCYMVVEDTNLGGNPIEIPGVPPGDEYDHKGPAEAVRKFQEEHPGMFEIDHARAEKFLFSMNTWMRRL